MSAWYVMSAMGLYPVAPGCDRYWTGVTLFDEVVVTPPNGKPSKVVARSLGAKPSMDKSSAALAVHFA
jgi:putative alpha-1,2-mannosidase